jgi:Putative beta-lactamase-inhibitor-like, PepSY-like
VKRIIPVIILVSCFIVHANAQLIKTPDLVKQAFDKQYPEAKLVDWKGGLDNHAVVFVVKEKKYKASYTSKGDWNYTETNIVFDSIPKQVLESFNKSKYKDWPVKEVITVEKPRAVANEYKIVVQKSKLSRRVLLFDAKGRLYEELMGL